jgi:hypothetical protein
MMQTINYFTVYRVERDSMLVYVHVVDSNNSSSPNLTSPFLTVTRPEMLSSSTALTKRKNPETTKYIQ